MPITSREEQSTTTDGCVIGFASGRGILLCRPSEEESIEQSVDNYLRYPSAKHWFVHFHFSAFDKEDRKALEDLRLRHKAEARKSFREDPTLGGVLVGRVVTCHVAKLPNWQVSSMMLDAADRHFIIPKKRRKNPVVGKYHPREKSKPERATFRATKDSNIGRPWQG